MSFQKTSAIVAGVILVISLIVVGVLAYNANNSVDYPPVSSQCPDYWEVKKQDDLNVCVNTKRLGKVSCPTTMKFSTSPWTGDKGLCRKKEWARSCDMSWDGVTNVDLKC